MLNFIEKSNFPPLSRLMSLPRNPGFSKNIRNEGENSAMLDIMYFIIT